jgi:hypothetical protein
MATKADTLFIGTELKLNIHIEPIETITMDDYDFEVEVYCSPKRPVMATKAEMIRVDSDNYIVLVDTNIVGAGSLKCKVTAYIPDSDFPDGLRTEVAMSDVGVNILKTI